MNKKRILKIAAILIILLVLTGCDAEIGKGIKGALVTNTLTKSFVIPYLNMLGNFNAAIAALMLGLFNFSASAKDCIDLILSFYSGSFGVIITVVQILAIVAIVIQFAKGVVKSNITGEGIGQSPIQQAKKVVTAVIVTFLVPYICISSFMLSTYAAVATTNLFSELSDSQANAWKIYEEMWKDHVNYGTLCANGQNEKYGVSDFDDWVNTDDTLSHADDTYEVILDTDSPKSVTGQSLNEKYCNAGEVSVYDTLKYSSAYQGVVILGGSPNAAVGVGAPNNEFLKLINSIMGSPGAKAIMGILSILFFVGIVVTFFLIIKATMSRVVDIIVLIAMSWWYIGASVADAPQQNSIGELAKKLLSICLTNFLMLFEFFLCLYTVLGHGFSLVTAIMCIVWIKVLTSTPTVVEEMVQSTGTVEEASGLVRTGASFIGKMMK